MAGKRTREQIKVGDTFGYWTVIAEAERGVNKCLCRCKCGTEKLVAESSLRNHDSSSCGCKSKEDMHKKAIEKMIGKKFGRLTVLEEAKNNKKAIYFKCRCDCGNEVVVKGSHLKSGLIVSCKCYNKERIHETNFRDLTGQRVGRLLVLGIDHCDKDSRYYYRCKCDCGNEVVIGSHQLGGSRPTLSCGCLHKEVTSQVHLQDLTGQKFGKLTVVKRVENSSGGETRYLCKCECGGEAIVTAPNLKKVGGTRSCGCINSTGEYKIALILEEQGIRFQKQKTFEDLKGYAKPKGNLRFDFYIPDKNYIIEYDGVQHFKAGKGWDTEEHVEAVQKRDRIKNEFCKEKGIPIIRIPYTHIEDICLEDLLLETSQFII